MKEEIFNEIEVLLVQKVGVFTDLLNCFKQEREYLINIELEKLWDVSKEKERLCKRIETIKKKMALLVNGKEDRINFDFNVIFQNIKREQGDRIRPLYFKLMRLKSEVNAIREENIMVINDSLRFLDDMIAILSGQGGEASIYDEKCRVRSHDQPAVLCRRV